MERHQQVPILRGISREHYAMHGTRLLLDGQVYPMLMSSVPQAWGTFDRKNTLLKLSALDLNIGFDVQSSEQFPFR